MSATRGKAPRVSFASLTPNNLGTVRKLNSVLFPIKYSEKFYQDILQPEVEDFCKLSMCLKLDITVTLLIQIQKYITMMFRFVIAFEGRRRNPHVNKVGTMCCKLENKDNVVKLYLMTMGVLAVCSRTSYYDIRSNCFVSLIVRENWALKAWN